MRIDRLLEMDSNRFDARGEYWVALVQYRKKYGSVTIWADNPRNDAEKTLLYLGEIMEKESHAIWAVCYVSGMDKEQRKRLHSATRALRRWEKATDYQKIASEKLMLRLEKYIIG